MQDIMPPVDTVDNLFHDGNPVTGEQGTIVSAEFLNNLQGATRDTQTELKSILTAAGIAVDPDKQNQVLTALSKLYLSRVNPGADIAADGAAAIATFLANLGLGEGSALPVGVPVPWPSATPPTGWLKCNGAAFSAEDYPNLAKAYPTLKLPDLRGEFIRGWDGGKGVDSGRTLLSAQGDAIRNITGVVGYSSIGDSQGLLGYVSGAFSASESKAPALSGASASGYQRSLYANFNASAVVPTANENRPRNIAFNYIVRAA